MSTTKKEAPTVELLHARSHWVELGHYSVIEREEVRLTFATEWRGTPVTVQVDCDRYSAGMRADAKTMGPWRVIVRTPHERTDEEWREGPACTETARSRLRPLIEPLAEAWLDSDAYRLSESAAYKFAILRELRNTTNQTTDARRALDRHGDKLDKLDRTRVLRACNKLDEFSVAYKVAMDGARNL